MSHTDLIRGDVAAQGWPAQETRRWRAKWQVATRPRGRPCGAPRIAEQREDKQLIGEAAPLFKHARPLFLIRVGLCPGSFFCR